MTERDDYESEYASRAPLRRFEADMRYAMSAFHLYSAYTNYFMAQFAISEEAAMTLYRQLEATLPSAELFEADAGLAVEQARLGLIRSVLPIAEDMIATAEELHEWLDNVVPIALGGTESLHTPEACLVKSHGPTEFSCNQAPNCPVRVVKYDLALDCFRADLQALDYDGEWAVRQRNIALTKLAVAEHHKLLAPSEARALRQHYLNRLKAHDLALPETGDI